VQILGLDICADTIVGDQMQRGISGGQKKRVTTGKYSFLLTALLSVMSFSPHVDVEKKKGWGLVRLSLSSWFELYSVMSAAYMPKLTSSLDLCEN
jgi:hypothetical protein